MKIHLKTPLAILLVSILIGFFSIKSIAITNNSFVQNSDTLKYSYRGFNNGLILLLNKNTFTFKDYYSSCFGDGKTKKVFGKFVIKDDKLILKPQKIELIDYPLILSEENDINPKVTQLKYGVDSLRIKTNYNIIRWRSFTYLLSEALETNWFGLQENDFIKFANYYNSGREPNKNGKYLRSKNASQKKSKNKLNLKQIPSKWRSYFLPHPISIKIKTLTKKIDYDGNKELISWFFEFNKGNTDGIRKGMLFETKSKNFLVYIDSVTQHSSFAKTYIYNEDEKSFPVGSELRTKWE
jgi:hypothetical protein